MCGIVGIIEKKGKKPAFKKLSAMLAAVSHRGPDDEGTYFNGQVGLGHRRLSIIDVSSAGHQPMANASKTLWLTYNGEVYNYLELKKAIGRRQYQSATDSEILLAGYEKWGSAVVKKLNGIFAFAIWDEEKKELFCARDHVGVKPFYYAVQNGVFYFGSEIKALLAGGVKTAPNESTLYDYLAYGYYKHSPETFFTGIRELPAGHTLTYKAGRVRIEPYWDLASKAARTIHRSDQETTEEFMEILESAITLQLRSDVPIGIQLSGGLDSSVVTAAIDAINKGQKNFRLFSFTYGGFKDPDKPFMLELAKKVEWKNEFFRLSPEYMPSEMERITWHQDEPFPGLPQFGLHFLASVCRKEGIPVVLGGQGGDEIGAGYEYYMGAFFIDMLREKGAAATRRELGSFGKAHGFTEKDAARFFTRSVSSYFTGGTSADGTSFVNTEVLRPAFAKRAHKERPRFEEPFDSALKNMQYRDIKYTKLPRVLHGDDRAAAAFGVEQRVPLVDYRLVEFGLSLSAEHKIRNGQQRYFIRSAFKKKLPHFVRTAHKRPVPSPQREWFAKELRPWIHGILASESFALRPYFNQKKVLAEYDRYCRSNTHVNSFHIWQWIHLEIWLRTFFD